jgi:Zn-dependent protease with chaperone function
MFPSTWNILIVFIRAMAQGNVRALIFFLTIAIPVNVFAQFKESYTPLSLSSRQSKTLVSKVKYLHAEELKTFKDAPNKTLIHKICSRRTSYIIDLVNSKFFIQNDDLEKLLNAMVDRIVQRNRLDHRHRLVLVLNSPEVNAFCAGRGLFVVTIGLLGRIATEDDLAFMLGHEIAHDELHHLGERIIQEAELNLSRKTAAQLTSILTSDVTLEDIESFRNLVYMVSAYSRKKELEADSLALSLCRNAGYNAHRTVDALFILDSAKSPKYDAGEKFFLPFDFSKYPFQNYWLKNRLSIYNRQPGNIFMLSIDSIQTHPELELRRNVLRANLTPADTSGIITDPFLARIITLAEFQTVEAAYRTRQYDLGLFQVLQLLTIYPGNRYLISRSGKMLIDLCNAKELKAVEVYVSKYTVNYSTRLRQVNNFLFNMTRDETAEVAFHFINNQTNFNDDDPSHYYLLWKICDLTYRNQLKEKIENAYKTRFHKSLAAYVYQ